MRADMLQSIGSTYIPHATRTGITSGKKYSNRYVFLNEHMIMHNNNKFAG